MSTRTRYRAYLLRLWREVGAPWRATLEDPHTGQRLAFATLGQLGEYLSAGVQTDFAEVEAVAAPTCPAPDPPPDDATEAPDWERSDDE